MLRHLEPVSHQLCCMLHPYRFAPPTLSAADGDFVIVPHRAERQRVLANACDVHPRAELHCYLLCLMEPYQHSS